MPFDIVIIEESNVVEWMTCTAKYETPRKVKGHNLKVSILKKKLAQTSYFVARNYK